MNNECTEYTDFVLQLQSFPQVHKLNARFFGMPMMTWRPNFARFIADNCPNSAGPKLSSYNPISLKLFVSLVLCVCSLYQFRSAIETRNAPAHIGGGLLWPTLRLLGWMVTMSGELNDLLGEGSRQLRGRLSVFVLPLGPFALLWHFISLYRGLFFIRP